MIYLSIIIRADVVVNDVCSVDGQFIVMLT